VAQGVVVVVVVVVVVEEVVVVVVVEEVVVVVVVVVVLVEEVHVVVDVVSPPLFSTPTARALEASAKNRNDNLTMVGTWYLVKYTSIV